MAPHISVLESRAAAVLGIAVAAQCTTAAAQDLAARTASFDLLDNGDFSERYEGPDPDRARRVPWWRVRGASTIVEVDGEFWLATPPGAVASQPVAAFGPLVDETRLLGRVHGRGVLFVADGGEGVARFEVGEAGRELAFEISGAALAAAFGRAPQPRLVLALAPAADATASDAARWTDVQAWVTLPCPSAETLRADLIARIDDVFEQWMQRGRAPESGFIHHIFDVVTGETIHTIPGGHFPVFDQLVEALAVVDEPRWNEALELFVEDYLARGLHPVTGLPQDWDLDAGRAAPERYSEVAADLGFLLDVAESGLDAWRERALVAAVELGETILAHGVLPDGAVAAKYRASDAAVSLAAPPIRRLDLPAQLARLGALTGDERFTRAARNALALLEYTHYWPGTWQGVDPGFDDDYGHYGVRAQVMLDAHPDDPAFRALVDSGYRFYAPLWRDALRFGGTIAADQTRCWFLLARFSESTPQIVPDLADLFGAATRAHFKSQQYKNGAWGDVTFVDFDPKLGIQVGDIPGAPANLLQGLGLVYDERFGLSPDLVRAMFATLLLTTDAQYRRPYGYLIGPFEEPQENRAGGGIRLLPGLIEMLARLD